MAGEPDLVICGNATADAELKYLPSGVALCSWTVASTPRVKDRDSWRDGETVFYRCTAWRQLAESAAETITRGMRLLVHGKLKVRSYEKDGEKRTSIEIDVENVGPELRYATASVKKVGRSSEQTGSPADDPWGSAPAASQQAGDDSPPF